MNGNSAFDIRGAAPWIGAIATAFVTLACDVESAEPEAQLRAAQVQDLELEEDTPAQAPDTVAPPSYPCDRSAHPSVHVVPSRLYYDYFLPVDVDMVWFEHEGQTYEARCVHDGNGDCTAWLAGYELAGPITVSTEYCDTVVSETVDVGLESDGCHVRTEFMILDVSTRGCLTSTNQQGDPPPPPRWPWALTSRTDPSEHPGHGGPLWRPSRLVMPPDGPPPPASDDMASPD